ncbi:hypothetical protein E1A91_A04G061900v1 [Gossypium mustelinum]|uniref:Uncharacterized protein n=1 Tax=Gossypium mustelinum TaxID=34275 RepID=A0A5D2ZKW4_GOSMU|nr:hypothetical protein E1A91_A04G061900v1 [Gossypium mustelinum]
MQIAQNASVFLASGQKVVLASSLHASRFFFGYAAIYYQEHPGLTWRHHKPCWYINCLKQVDFKERNHSLVHPFVQWNFSWAISLQGYSGFDMVSSRTMQVCELSQTVRFRSFSLIHRL